ncbi:MAG TPA: NAD(P)/FAD-dependent oxidoreductase [Micromonosporaceae bacterium]|nr:NAD(P)/FAD-dependent oxidoreductase [Micromonosporaceae bacterium]
MAVDQVDVLIIGAGLSGVGAACHLRRRCPEKTFAILESRGAIGGTWDLFRYPGIRSDSDMFTLGYPFRPWPEEKSIAGGTAIRSYICDTAREYGVDDKIRFHHRVTEASWSSADAQWTVTAHRTDTAQTVRLRCSLLFMCTGYYRYDEGYTPQFAGVDRFAGPVVHPQHWPEDLDYTGKRVVVIGSGATAVTVVPAMAERAAHVTMLQRSPSYVLSLPEVDVVANALRRMLPRKLALWLVRWKNVLLTMAIFQLSRRAPQVMRRLHHRAAQARLPEGYDVQTHFNPGYDPWDQRMCFVPDGDLFTAISSGKASVVTDHIDTFTEHGIRLVSGTQLDADIVVTATGLNLQPLGGMRLAVDGADIDLAKTVAYKGMMLSGVPNLMLALGYTNAAWTLKCDLTSEYACRVLNHMDRHGYQVCTPVAPESSQLDPLIDLQSGYVLRGLDKLPKQGPRAPWRLYQNYPRDVRLLRHGAVEDEGVRFSRAPAPQPAAQAPHA